MICSGTWIAVIIAAISQASAIDIEPTCKVVCKASQQKKPVCASDRKSYPSKCEVRRQRICLGKKNLEWIHEGECAATPKQRLQLPFPTSIFGDTYATPVSHNQGAKSNCTAKREDALDESRKLAGKLPGSSTNLTTVMIPSCKSDGTYEEVQCHPATRYCWCVNSADGVPVTETSVLGSRPSCGSADSDVSQSADCSDTERAQFNSNLIQKFSTEHDDVPQSVRWTLTSGWQRIQGLNDDNSKIAAWKFNSMDTNGDKELSRHELKELKRDVRKNIKPKGCAKLFITNCDKNTDSLITKQEWEFCLGRNTHHPKEDQHSPELMEHQNRIYFDMLSGESPKRETEDNPPRPRNDGFNEGANDRIDRSPLNDQTVDINRKLVSLDRKTCNDERVTALSKGSENSQRFVPSCQSDGNYEPKQCHLYSGYCWCVNPHTGVPIPGTSRMKELPQCSKTPSQEPPPTPQFPDISGSLHDPIKNKGGGNTPRRIKNRKKLREIPGCPDPNHGAFLTQLVDLLTREMASAGGSLPAELTNSANMSLDEKAIRWKVITADKNDDKKLSKKEMRFVRHMVKENLIKAPEKCGKKFMKYCDRNSDNYITVEELLVCTEVRKKAKREQRKQSGTKSGNKARHRGKERNPFTDILMPSPLERK